MNEREEERNGSVRISYVDLFTRIDERIGEILVEVRKKADRREVRKLRRRVRSLEEQHEELDAVAAYKIKVYRVVGGILAAAASLAIVLSLVFR